MTYLADMINKKINKVQLEVGEHEKIQERLRKSRNKNKIIDKYSFYSSGSVS